MKSLLLMVLCFVLSVSAWDTKRAQLGALDGFVERMGSGVRSLGMGNIHSEATGFGAYANPALLAGDPLLRIDFAAEQRSLDRQGLGLSLQKTIGSRMGLGGAILWRGISDFKVIDEDEQELGTAQPAFYMGYLGLGWRLSRKDRIGLSFAESGENLGVRNLYHNQAMLASASSPLAYAVGWYRQWNAKWETGAMIRNLGFNSRLSASWTHSTSSDNSTPSSAGFRPKSLELTQVYHGSWKGQKVDLRMQWLDYQLGDTLMVFDPDWHQWMARLGVEWMLSEALQVRGGYDAGNWSLGASARLNAKFWLHYACVLESQVQQINPLNLGIDAKF